jgi:hypothetical protein
MTFEEFHNALRIMRNIDMHELVEAGVFHADNVQGYRAFASDPYRWFIGASDGAAKRVFDLVIAQQPESLKHHEVRQAANHLDEIFRYSDVNTVGSSYAFAASDIRKFVGISK